MEFTYTQRQIYTNIFNRGDISESTNISEVGQTLDNHNIFNRYCVTDITGDNIEIPLITRVAVEDVIMQNLNWDKDYTKVVVPMYTNAPSQSRRTSDSIIKDFFSRVHFSQRLKKIITNKGEIYYGGRGIIFDSDFNPLFLCTINGKKDLQVSMNKLLYDKITIYIHPKVFINNEGIIQKAIVKKLIPFYVSNRFNLIGSRVFISNPNITAEVVIADASSKFIETPEKPSPQKCSNEILNQLLIDNIDDVLNQFA